MLKCNRLCGGCASGPTSGLLDSCASGNPNQYIVACRTDPFSGTAAASRFSSISAGWSIVTGSNTESSSLTQTCGSDTVVGGKGKISSNSELKLALTGTAAHFALVLEYSVTFQDPSADLAVFLSIDGQSELNVVDTSQEFAADRAASQCLGASQ